MSIDSVRTTRLLLDKMVLAKALWPGLEHKVQIQDINIDEWGQVDIVVFGPPDALPEAPRSKVFIKGLSSEFVEDRG